MARVLRALLPQLAACLCLSPAGLVNERVEDIQEESHNCGRGGQDEISDAAFIWVLGGVRIPLLATGPPGVSCRPLGCFKLQFLFFSLQFLPDQRSLRCGNLRQHSENTMGNTPRPVPSQPASPCSTVAVAPAPAALQGLRRAARCGQLPGRVFMGLWAGERAAGSRCCGIGGSRRGAGRQQPITAEFL